MENKISPRRPRVARGAFRALLAVVATLAVGAAYADGPPQRIIVKYRTNLATNDRLTSAANSMTTMTGRYGVSMRAMRRMYNGAVVMTLDREMTDRDYDQLVKEVAASDDVEYAERDRMLKRT